MAHILSAPGTAERTGWCCPSCSRSYAPWVYSCPHCPAKTAEPACDPLVIRLPPFMAAENAVQASAVRGVWTEVFPGLQAQLRDVRQGLATVEFRRTPEGGEGQ